MLPLPRLSSIVCFLSVTLVLLLSNLSSCIPIYSIAIRISSCVCGAIFSTISSLVLVLLFTRVVVWELRYGVRKTHLYVSLFPPILISPMPAPKYMNYDTTKTKVSMFTCMTLLPIESPNERVVIHNLLC